MAAFPPLAGTGIGSVPFTDPQACVSLILENLAEVPFWPQMVRLGYREDMVPQGVRGLPAMQVDVEARAVLVDPDVPRELALAQFYELAWGEDLSAFAMDPGEAQGFFALLAAVAARSDGPPVLKGQVVGPVTFAGMVKDQNGKAILYDRDLTQAVCQGLARKAAWQAQKFRELGKTALIFFDEPILTGFGSAFFTISKEEVMIIFNETLEAARQPGPIVLGTHCCGNTDWSLFLESPVDVLSFDSYGYFDSLLLYDQPLRQFLERGSWLAWGLVPTGEELHQETSDSLWKRFQDQVRQLAERGGLSVRDVLSQALLTPSCGLGYLSPETATRALGFLTDLSARGRQWLSSLA